jgi:3-deoxy-manno-octulosonate cytidylyltransferase (CMP-KDO synthetase)
MSAAYDVSVQMASTSTLVLIPARMASTRLPGKPLADIAGLPMIVQVLRRAEAAKIGRAVVATDTDEIASAVRAHGGEAVLTRSDHPSGSDRIFEALQRLDPEGRVETIVNLQGDLPTIDPAIIRRVVEPLADAAVDIATLAVEITRDAERADPNVVKAVAAFGSNRIARALYFSRATVPANQGPHYHHIGIYAYRRGALERFVALPPGLLEKRERLEQLRALEAGMRIDVALVDTLPLGVDTPAELERARAILAHSTS